MIFAFVRIVYLSGVLLDLRKTLFVQIGIEGKYFGNILFVSN